MKLLEFLTDNVRRLTILSLLTLVSWGTAEAKVKISTPSASMPATKACPYGGNSGGSSSSSSSSKRENKHSAIYAEGHNVRIEGRSNGETYIWIDYDNNGKVNVDEETLTCFMSWVYIYGGKCDGNIGKTSYNNNLQTITMTGGSVGAIFGGGFACNGNAESTRDIKIEVTGGTVGVVDGGGDDYDGKYSAVVKGNVSILLQDCDYTSSYYINGNTVSQVSGTVEVRDFSKHTNWSPKWGKEVFTNSIIQTGKDTLRVKWNGTAVIPSSVNMYLDYIYVPSGTTVKSEGLIHLRNCNLNEQIKGTWTGRAIDVNHNPSELITSKGTGYHNSTCLNCGANVSRKHIWGISASTDKNHENATHYSICTVCGYYYTVPCDVKAIPSENGHIYQCQTCKAEFEWAGHEAKIGTCKSYSSYLHSATCNVCATYYIEDHWLRAVESPSCDLCSFSDHKHNYDNGKCTICQYEHPYNKHDFDEDTKICNICHKGCDHTKTIDNTTYSTLKFNEEASNTVAGHYYTCDLCKETIKQSEHTMVDTYLNGYCCTDKSVGCTFVCDHHVDSLKMTQFTSSRTYTTPGENISYQVDHELYSCCHCNQSIACKVTDQDGNVYYKTSLQAALELVDKNSLKMSTITLMDNITLSKYLCVELKRVDTLYLDMNNFDIRYTKFSSTVGEPSFRVYNGTLVLYNSQFGDGQYANIYNTCSLGTIYCVNGAHACLSGVHVSRLSQHGYEFTLGNVEVDNLTASASLDILDTCHVTIYNSFYTSGQLRSRLPKGFVVSEFENDSIWTRKYDQTSTIQNKSVGPIYRENLLRIERCNDHFVDAAIAMDENGHSGTCVYCGNYATNLPHSMTLTGQKKDDQYHYKRCEHCTYEGGELPHIFDMSTGMCTASTCSAPAMVELRLQNEEDPRYFSSFEAAWNEANRPGCIDTLILLNDVTVSQPLTIQYARDTTQQSGNYYIPYFIIQGEGKTLSYAGEGDPLRLDAQVTVRDAVLFEKGLNCTRNWAIGTAPALPIVGCIYNTDSTSIITCTSHDNEYRCMKDTLNNALPYHEGACKKCRYQFDQNHIYNGTSNCQYCGVDRVIVVNADAEINGVKKMIGVYGSLNEAFLAATDSSARLNVPVTIHVLRDLEVEKDEHSGFAGAIMVDTPGAELILDATDPNDASHEFELISHYDCMIYVNRGKLTILSGKYQSMCNTIKCAERSDAYVQLMGGTFWEGMLKLTFMNTDGIIASYSRYYSTYSKGLGSMIAPGYILRVNRPNHDDNYPKLTSGSIASYASPATVVSASGTVEACTHPAEMLGDSIVALAVSCEYDGHLAHRVCGQCGAYLHWVDGKRVCDYHDAVTQKALGHQFKLSEDGDSICDRCGRSKCAVLVTVQKRKRDEFDHRVILGPMSVVCQDSPYESFLGAWNSLASNGYLRDTIQYFITYKLNADVDFTGIEETFEPICAWGNFTIDLNGHNMNLGSKGINVYYYGTRYPGEDTLTICDSKRSDAVFKGNINLDHGSKTLVVSGTDVIIKDSICYISLLQLKDSAGITLSENTHTKFGVINMEPGTYFGAEGNGIISFKDKKVQSTDLGEALHNVVYFTKVDDAYTQVKGQGTSSFSIPNINYDETNLWINMPGKEGVGSNDSWRATRPAETTTHVFYGMMTNQGDLHYGDCSICGFLTRGAHNYVNHKCFNCGNRAEAYVVIDGINTDYTKFSSALFAVNGKNATLVLNADAKASATLDAGTALTLDLNGHVWTAQSTYALYVDSANVVITDTSDEETEVGTITSASELGSSVIVSGNKANKLTVLRGNFDAKDGALIVNADSVNVKGYPTVVVRGGKFASIRTGSLDASVLDLLGQGCYFCTNAEGALVDVSQRHVYANGTDGYCYLDDVYAYSGDMQLDCDQNLEVVKAASVEDDQYTALVDEAIANIGVLSFSETRVSQVVNFEDPVVMLKLQQAVMGAGHPVYITADDDLQGYIEARLLSVSVDELNVIGNADSTKVQALTRMTFDVEPYATARVADDEVAVQITSDQLLGSVSFRLPVDARYEVAVLTVYHTGEDSIRTKVGDYEVRSQLSSAGTVYKYIELNSSVLGIYDYQVESEFTLADAKAICNRDAETFEHLYYTRTFEKQDQWEALYIPMSISPSADIEIADIYTFGNLADTNGDGVIDESDETVLIVEKLSSSDTTEPNSPYWIRQRTAVGEPQTIASVDGTLYAADTYTGSCSSARTEYTFNGIYSATTINDQFAFAMKQGSIQSVDGTVLPQRWFIQMTSKVGGYNEEIAQAKAACIRIFTIGDDLDEETALRVLKGDSVDVWQDGKRYTLDGRRAVHPTKEIQIINNKKVIKK